MLTLSGWLSAFSDGNFNIVAQRLLHETAQAQAESIARAAGFIEWACPVTRLPTRIHRLQQKLSQLYFCKEISPDWYVSFQNVDIRQLSGKPWDHESSSYDIIRFHKERGGEVWMVIIPNHPYYQASWCIGASARKFDEGKTWNDCLKQLGYIHELA